MMTRLWSATCAAIVVVFTVGLVAQTSAPQPPPAAPQSAPAAAKTITITGCVAPVPAGTGTTGTAGSSSSEPKFLVTNVAPAATGAAPATATPKEYRLDVEDAKISSHVGHKVEIVGTPDASMATPPASGAAVTIAPKLKVETVKMVAATCP